MKFADVKNDVAFRKIFGDAKKSIALISFLNAVLELEGSERVKSVEILNPYLLPQFWGDKSAIVDVRATDYKGNRFIVEMQVANKKGFTQRVQYYTARDYSIQIESGDDYPKLRPTYFIGIVDFKVGKGKHYISKHLTVEQETGDCILGDMKYAFIQLPKFRLKEQDLVTASDKWTFFIKNAKNLKVIPDFVTDEGLKTAFVIADKHTWNKEELIAYDNFDIGRTDKIMELEFARDEGRDEARAIAEAEKEVLRQAAEARETVLRQAAEAEKEQMIFQMHKTGLSSSQIAAITQKNETEINEIIAKYQ